MRVRSVSVFLLALAAATAGAQNSIIVAGTAGDVLGQVKVFDGLTHTELSSFIPFSGFTGGVRVAAGDVNGDGTPDIVTGAGAGSGAGGPHVKVFDGRTYGVIHDFFAFDPSFVGGVNVATGDVNGDGLADLVVGSGVGAAHVKVFDGLTGTELRSFLPYSASYAGGVRVASGDLDGDGRADLVVGTETGSSHVKAFDGQTLSTTASFFAYDPSFTGGVNVGTLDFDGDGDLDLLTGAATDSPHVKALGLDGSSLASFFAFSSGGVSVAGLMPDGRTPHLVVGSQTDSLLRIYDPLLNTVGSFDPFGLGRTVGVNVAAAFSPVPEPASLAALGLGIAAVVRRRLRPR